MVEQTDAEFIAEMKALAENAQIEWARSPQGRSRYFGIRSADQYVGSFMYEPDADFAVASRTAIPRLIGMVEAEKKRADDSDAALAMANSLYAESELHVIHRAEIRHILADHDRVCKERNALQVTAVESVKNADRWRIAHDRIEEENFALAANQCHAGYSDEGGSHRCREVDAAIETKTRLDTPDENGCWYGVEKCTLPHCDCEKLTSTRAALASKETP